MKDFPGKGISKESFNTHAPNEKHPAYHTETGRAKATEISTDAADRKEQLSLHFQQKRSELTEPKLMPKSFKKLSQFEIEKKLKQINRADRVMRQDTEKNKIRALDKVAGLEPRSVKSIVRAMKTGDHSPTLAQRFNPTVRSRQR